MKKTLILFLLVLTLLSLGTSANAMPPAGFYIGGDIAKYYSLEAFVSDANLDTALEELVYDPSQVLYVDHDGYGAGLVDLLQADDMSEVMHFVTEEDFDYLGNISSEYTVVNEDGSTGETIDPVLELSEEPQVLVDDDSVIIGGHFPGAKDVRVTLTDTNGKASTYYASKKQVTLEKDGTFQFSANHLTHGTYSYELVSIVSGKEVERITGSFQINE